MRKLIIGTIKIYKKVLSPLMPRACRFSPTCSEFFIEALEEHGTIRGSFLGIKRILRCHPLHPGGYDPVPKKRIVTEKSSITE